VVHLVDSLDRLTSQGKRFATVYADPPWQYGNRGTRAAARRHYDTMTVDEICELPVKSLTGGEALLWLWTTSGFLFDAQQVIEAWGFSYRASMVWVKPQMGLGNYVRNCHEFLLIANRGALRPNGRNQRSWIEAPRGRHSAKPNVFREVVESISPGPRLEIFGREARPGWTVFGNQIDPQRFLTAPERDDVLTRAIGHIGPLSSRTSKAEAVTCVLSDPAGAALSDREIASAVGVSPTTVGKYRAELTRLSKVDSQPARVGRDGRTINTAKIGRKGGNQQDPKPVAPGKTSIPSQLRLS